MPDDAHVAFLEVWGTQLIVATDQHHLFAGDPTDARGWRHLGAELPGPKITALHVAGDDVFVGVYEQGLFVGREGGKRWEFLQRDLPDPKVRAISLVDDEILVGTDSGMWKSRAGQSHYERVFAECQVVTLQHALDRIVAGTACGALLSADRGETWAFVHREGALHNTAILPAANEDAEARVVLMNISGDVRESRDWGRSWRPFDYGPRAKSYVYEVVESADHLILSNNYGIHSSAGDGRAWEHVYFTEQMVFSDLVTMGGVLYGGTRPWGERRARSR